MLREILLRRRHWLKEKASFEYEADWLPNPLRYALEPALALGKGQYDTPPKLFGSLGDSAPDRWGRTLMKRTDVDAGGGSRKR